MKALPLVALLFVAAAAWFLLAGAPRPEPAGAGAPRPPRGAPRVSTPALALPERNVFEYAEAPKVAPVEVASARPRPTAPPETLPPAPAAPEPVRLIGLVNRSGHVRAVLSVLGEVAVVGPGDEVQGYRVLAIDEEHVRLRAPDGTERALARPDGG